MTGGGGEADEATQPEGHRRARAARRWDPDAATGWVPFAVALAVYVLLGLLFKSVVLNWIVGPLFPLVALYLVPGLVRRGGLR